VKAKQGNLKIVLAGLLLAILMASMDNTIVATAMGTIVGELGGLDKFVWVTSAYMVAEMAGMPIFGKLSDMFGRKKFSSNSRNRRRCTYSNRFYDHV
jgi:MFS family permease